MIGQIKVLVVNGRNFPITDRLYEILKGDSEIEVEISKIVADGTAKIKKAGKKK